MRETKREFYIEYLQYIVPPPKPVATAENSGLSNHSQLLEKLLQVAEGREGTVEHLCKGGPTEMPAVVSLESAKQKSRKNM